MNISKITEDWNHADEYLDKKCRDTNDKIDSVISGKQDKLTAGSNITISGNTISATDTNTWRPLGTTADTACAGNDSRLSDARPANGGTSTKSLKTNQLEAFTNDNFSDGNHFIKAIRSPYGWNTHLWMCYDGGGKQSDAVSVNYANSAGSAPASDVYSWAKQSTKPSYTASEVGAISRSELDYLYANCIGGKNVSQVTSGTGPGFILGNSGQRAKCKLKSGKTYVIIYNQTASSGVTEFTFFDSESSAQGQVFQLANSTSMRYEFTAQSNKTCFYAYCTVASETNNFMIKPKEIESDSFAPYIPTPI